MRSIVSAALVVAGIIHLLPVQGVVGSARLAALYGIPFGEPNLALLMRHRAVLLGLAGVLLVTAAFRSSLRVAALVAGFISAGSFLALATAGGYTAEIQRVVVFDWVALASLAVALVAHTVERRRGAAS